MSLPPSDFSDLLEKSSELRRLTDEKDEVHREISKKLEELQATPDLHENQGDTLLSELKRLYARAKSLSERGVNFYSGLLSELDARFPGSIGHQERTREDEQKMEKMKQDSDIPGLSPSIGSQLDACASLKGEQVAARVTAENAIKDHWFVAKVMHFDRKTKEFEVLSEACDDEESRGKSKLKVHMSCIIPFPKQNDLSSVPEFLPRENVLAIYPGTTALHKAVVVSTPVESKTDNYLLEFDNDKAEGALSHRAVPYHMVVPLPEGPERQ